MLQGRERAESLWECQPAPTPSPFPGSSVILREIRLSRTFPKLLCRDGEGQVEEDVRQGNDCKGAVIQTAEHVIVIIQILFSSCNIWEPQTWTRARCARCCTTAEQRGHLPQSPATVRCCYRQGVGRRWDSDPHQLSASARQKARSIQNPLYKCTIAGSSVACVDFRGGYKARDVFLYPPQRTSLSVGLQKQMWGSIFCVAAREGFREGPERGFQQRVALLCVSV